MLPSAVCPFPSFLSVPSLFNGAGDVAGNWNGSLTNLKTDSFEAFANYLADVVQHYAEDPEWNIQFESLGASERTHGGLVEGRGLSRRGVPLVQKTWGGCTPWFQRRCRTGG